jgi:hypothetical protein
MFLQIKIIKHRWRDYRLPDLSPLSENVMMVSNRTEDSPVKEFMNYYSFCCWLSEFGLHNFYFNKLKSFRNWVHYSATRKLSVEESVGNVRNDTGT